MSATTPFFVPSPASRTGPRSLVATGLCRSYAGRTVLDSVDVTVSPGTVLAVVGENGAGKSTLLRLLAGIELPDSGVVSRPADVGHLGQELTVPPGTTVGDVLDAALAGHHAAVARLEVLADRLGDPEVDDEYAATLDWAVLHDAWDADRRAEETASRLGLARVRRDRPVAALSGGERARLALAALLTRQPDCLLLDEPTNHLDDGAVEHVEEVVRGLPGVVVVASHDRVLLDRVADAVLDLDPTHFGADGQGGRLHGGGWSAFLAERGKERRRWEQGYAEQQEELERLRETAATTARRVAPGRGPRDNDKFIHHFKGANVQRTVARRVRDAERRLGLLEKEQLPKPPAVLSFSRALVTGSGASVQVRDLEVAGRLRLDRLDVASGERLLVTGANGSGKSTLLKVLARRLAPSRGEVHVSARRLGYLPQDVRFTHPGASAAAVYSAAAGGSDGEDGATVPPLGSLGLLHPRDVRRPVGELSTGQQRRLALAVLVARQPELVLLDEPTNHLSLALADELEEALGRSAGTVVVASHDRWLRRRWDGSVLGLSPSAG